MSKKHTNADTDADLEEDFNFSEARPNPYVGWPRRAEGQSSETPPVGSVAAKAAGRAQKVLRSVARPKTPRQAARRRELHAN